MYKTKKLYVGIVYKVPFCLDMIWCSMLTLFRGYTISSSIKVLSAIFHELTNY